jgi:hypothetical protein
VSRLQVEKKETEDAGKSFMDRAKGLQKELDETRKLLEAGNQR